MTSSKVNQLQLLQQNLQALLNQKQQAHNQVVELESALAELKTTTKAYRILGRIMVAASPEELSKELSGKKELMAARLRNIGKQEERLNHTIEELQQEVLKELQK